MAAAESALMWASSMPLFVLKEENVVESAEDGVVADVGTEGDEPAKEIRRSFLKKKKGKEENEVNCEANEC